MRNFILIAKRCNEISPRSISNCLIRHCLTSLLILSAWTPTSFGQTSKGQTPGVAETEISDGWLSLFDGATLFGWHAMTDANWKVVEGEIHVSEGTVGLLRTSSQFDDFELQLEVKTKPRTNSGIFLKTSPKPTDPTVDCLELNIAGRLDSPFPTGSLVGRVAAKHDYDVSDWSKIRIVSNGGRVQAWVNQSQSCDYTEPVDRQLGRGYIGLQFNSGPAAFRNIRILPLNFNSIEISDDWRNWNRSATRHSTFSITEEGELHIRGGSGQLETKETFGDFILSLKCRTGGAGMNSGIFFRCIPGEYMNGYESQIHNQFKSNDRSQPVDCGTGGIFRRAPARIVNADDEEWFTKTIIACGANISVWVNGYQVTDWTDRRAEDPNPRHGKRLEAGTIILQGHDPETDILMKEFKVRELNKRGR